MLTWNVQTTGELVAREESNGVHTDCVIVDDGAGLTLGFHVSFAGWQHGIRPTHEYSFATVEEAKEAAQECLADHFYVMNR